jgi:hypothetical protein
MLHIYMIGSHYVVQADLELEILLLSFPSAGITGVYHLDWTSIAHRFFFSQCWE